MGSTRIIGWGESPYDPSHLVDNDQVLELLREKGTDTKNKSGQDTENLVGIRTRLWSPLEHTSTWHAHEAAKAACLKAAENTNGEFAVDKLELIHCGSSTPDYVFPSMANELHGLLGVPTGGCEARDISDACNSSVNGLCAAKSRMADKSLRYGLIAAGETIGTRLNAPTSLNHCLWGDGGGALVLEYDAEDNSGYGILADKCISDGQYADWTKSLKLGTHPDNDTCTFTDASMEGHEKDIQRYAQRQVPAAVQAMMEEYDVFDDGAPPWLLSHNANLKIQIGIGKSLCIPESHVLTSIKERGNTSSASIPITLAKHANMGTFQNDDILILLGFGGGMSMGIVFYRWG